MFRMYIPMCACTIVFVALSSVIGSGKTNVLAVHTGIHGTMYLMMWLVHKKPASVGRSHVVPDKHGTLLKYV